MAKALIKILCLLAMATSTLAFLSSMCDNKSIGSRIAFPMACEKFIVCGEGARVASVKTCPSGLHFNAAIEECDLKTKAGCERSNFWAAADTCDTSTCCACCDCSGCTKCDNDLQYCVGQPDGFYPYPLDCTQYIQCINECTTINQCPDRTLWLYETGECGDPCKAVCPNNPYCPNGCANGLDICANSTDGTQIPNPNQCGTYYVCRDKCAVPEKCRPGELFNPDTLRCEEACRVKCPGSGYPCTNGCTNGSTICENQPDGTELPNPNECGSYYVCKNKCPETRTCDEGQLFNPLTLRCEEACNVNCPGSGYPCSGGCEGGSEICKDITDGTQFPNDNQCGWFYECKDQCPVPGQCANGQLFNPETRRCEQACNVNCPGSGYPCGNGCEGGSTICENQLEGVQLPNPEKCGTFYICRDKCPVNGECAEGLLFNPATRECEKACTVDCPGSNYPCDNKCENGLDICENSLDGTQLPNYNQCGTYFECQDKCPRVRECLEGLLFNPVTRKCEKSCNVNCPGSGFPCSEECANGLDICREVDDGTLIPNYSVCGTFFVCDQKCPVPRECPDGQLFNPETLKCGEPCLVDCPGSNFPCSKCENGLTACVGKPDGFYPYPNDCTRSIECTKECATINTCPYNTLWDNDRQKCIPACEANCPNNPYPCFEGCPEGFEICKDKPFGSYQPIPEDCSLFVVCDDTCEDIRNCAEGLLFNPKTNRCDKACAVDCPGSGYPCANPPPAGPSGHACDSPGMCVDKPDGTLFKDPNTNGYIVCQCECEIPRPCPDGLIFNQNLQTCDWPPKQ